jgi:hypothetical protein
VLEITFKKYEDIFILATKLIKEDLISKPVHFIEEENKIFIDSSSTELQKQLTTLGLKSKTVKNIPKESKKVSCLAELIQPEKQDNYDSSIVLFVPKSQKVNVVDLAGELLRLGCDRQDLCFLKEEPYFLLKAMRPPYFSVAKTLDKDSQVVSFVPTPSGQEQIWSKVGYKHPLGQYITPNDKNIILILNSGRFVTLKAGPWTNIYDWMTINTPKVKTPDVVKENKKLEVTLRLDQHINNKTPELWLVTEESVLDNLCQTLSENELEKWLFSVIQANNKKGILLKPSRAQKFTPILNIDASGFCKYKDVENLYIPKNTSLEPPLTEQTVRDLLSQDPEKITWLEKTEDSFVSNQVDLSSFVPLTKWINYVFDSNVENITTWVQSVGLEIQPYVSVGCEWSDRPKKEQVKKEEVKQEEKRVEQKEEVSESVTVEKKKVKKNKAKLVEEVSFSEPGEEEKEIAKLEEAYLESTLPLDHPDRTEMWTKLGMLYSKNGNADSLLCWSRAVWEDSSMQPLWLQSEEKSNAKNSPLKVIEKKETTQKDIRLVVSSLLCEETLDRETLRKIKLWLSNNEEKLDVRTIWLVNSAIARLSGGDNLLVAQVRDRLLNRTMNGLSIEKDVPTFMRFCASRKGSSQSIAKLTEELDNLYSVYFSSKREKSKIEANKALTDAYTQFIFAYGYARLGSITRAKEEQENATKKIDTKDTIHDFLVTSFTEKIQQAIAGMPVDHPLSENAQIKLNKLDNFDRYKANRIRQASMLLEYRDKIDPVGIFQKTDTSLDSLFASLYKLESKEEKLEKINAIIADTLHSEEKEQVSRISKILDFLPTLGEYNFTPTMKRLMPVFDKKDFNKVEVLAKALMVSGFFSKKDLVEVFVKKITSGISKTSKLQDFANILSRCTGSLRRAGLNNEALELLNSVSSISTGTEIENVLIQLQISSSFSDLGKLDEAKKAIAAGQKVLEQEQLLMSDKLSLIRALSLSAGNLPEEQAIGALRQMYSHLETITDSFNTNSHLCLSIVNFMESLVLGFANDRLSLGDLGKKWLAEDEYLVRKRIHADFEAGV